MNDVLRFAGATAPDLARARTVVVGADTRGAGFSESARGAAQVQNREFCMDVVRAADRESPSLVESLTDGGDLFDAGNLVLSGGVDEQVAEVRARVRDLLAARKRVVLLGGDHLVKYALLGAASDVADGPVGVVYFDAHPDCTRSERLYFGSILHHAWSLPHLAPARTPLVGLRQVNPEERAALAHYQPPVVSARTFEVGGFARAADDVRRALDGARSVVFSVDLDGLRPSDAPGVETPYPGGPPIDALLELVRVVGAEHPLVALDVSEFLVEFDVAKQTALAVARIVYEAAEAGR